jgi:hypothetical protein
MKKLLTYLALIVPFAGISQYDTIFHTNKINILTVSVDYQDYSFSGASMNYYDCPACHNDTLPYEIDYDPPMDFGSMTFQLSPSNDTIFHGGIVWMGTGQISHPSLSSNTSAPFDNLGTSLPLPSQISYLNDDGTPIPASSETDLAWESVSQLRIVQLIANDDYDVLCYFYPPTVGALDPDPAKFIFFFYKKNYPGGPVGIDENTKLNVSIYPNPATEKLHFSSQFNLQSYTMSDLTGKVIEIGKTNSSNEIYVEHFSNGVYFVEFENEEGVTQKLKWIKQ